MTRNITVFLVCIVLSKSVAFISTAGSSKLSNGPTTSLTKGPFFVAETASRHARSKSVMKRDMVDGVGAIETQYDTVKVDLSDGRDYPIYIGDDFSDVEAGKMIRSHIKGNRALLITNDRVAPMHLERYERLLKEGGDIQIGESIRQQP